ncbi:pantoate--beta-alanine ligase [Sulfurirhabdus autotrophica]|uniref:Pantothenate synthetase n=1 Tax=Sulfurirhabdus autotrophica TaxID=1706046 RepID=A0A4R3Y2F0_9PROT|nr:pantoate--beta-alanine ligase [Sulfurirhabdus autotrophica]TCV85876.1 pantothenate synthetase [Sulfurirhabdus autotrophica]
MEIISKIPVLQERLQPETDIAFVPTMGNLHEGHLALMALAKKRSKCVVASIFVNPMQFGPQEDLAKYPRTLAEDCHKLQAAGVDVVFTPTEQTLYPEPQQVLVEPPPIANELCGAYRPGHFRGVATVVLKLFNIVTPSVAVFGKKDYQQLHVIRSMVRQLNIPVEVVAGETMRAADGLALSSRNGFLSETQRDEAVRLFRNLEFIMHALVSGSRDFAFLENNAKAELEKYGWRVDYFSIRHQHSLSPAQVADTDLVILAACWLGGTRLIDNLEVFLPA